MNRWVITLIHESRRILGIHDDIRREVEQGDNLSTQASKVYGRNAALRLVTDVVTGEKSLSEYDAIVAETLDLPNDVYVKSFLDTLRSTIEILH